MPISDCYTQHLFLLIGGNTLPNYIAARLLADKDTTLYLVHSKGTVEQRAALHNTLNPNSQHASYRIKDILVEETNPVNIYQAISNVLANIPANIAVGLHYTGGTKVMSVHAYRAIQDWQKQKGNLRRACYTYLDARTLHLWAERSDWQGAQALFVGDKLNVSLSELLVLHRRDELRKPVRTEAIWPSVAQELLRINGKEILWKTWTKAWEPYNKYEERNEHKLSEELAPICTDKLHTDSELQKRVYEALRVETGLAFPTTFGEIIHNSVFNKPTSPGVSTSPFYEAVKWFNGGWFEDYVFLQVQQLAKQYDLHDLALSVQPKIGNKDFEFDVVAMRHYQLFAFSCTLDRKRATCKHKLLEAVARARQLGGSEARIALVCCYEDASDLQYEVETLVRDNQLKVFGRSDLPQLQTKIEAWINDLEDRLTRNP